jgi:hypothetical protein
LSIIILQFGMIGTIGTIGIGIGKKALGLGILGKTNSGNG